MKNKILIILNIFALATFGAGFNCADSLVKNGCRLEIYNDLGIKFGEIDLTQSTWFELQGGKIKIYDNKNNYTFQSDCLVSPAWSDLKDSLMVWSSECAISNVAFPTNLDTTQIDTSLIMPILTQSIIDTLSEIKQLIALLDTSSQDTILDKSFTLLNDSINVYLLNDTIYIYDLDTSFVYTIDSTYSLQLDSVISLLSDTLNVSVINDSINVHLLNDSIYVYDNDFDTIFKLNNYTYYTTCYIRKIDTHNISRIIVSDLNNVASPPKAIFFVDVNTENNIYAEIDGVPLVGTYPDVFNDYIPCDVKEYYFKDTLSDSVIIISVPNGNKNLDGIIDTFNCQSVSFSWRGVASGVVYITGSDGITLDYLPTDPLPYFAVNEPNKLQGIIVDGTGATGIRANYQGCEKEICIEKTITKDCINDVIIPTTITLYGGWFSNNGAWFFNSTIK